MRRKAVIRIAAAVSLAFCATTVTLGMSRSSLRIGWGHASVDQLHYHSWGIEWGFGLYTGKFSAAFTPGLNILENDATHVGTNPAKYGKVYPTGLSAYLSDNRVEFFRLPRLVNQNAAGPVGQWGYRGVRFPPWLVLMVSGAGSIPLWNSLRNTLRRRSAIRNHRCLGCGYDLRATPARCPECGMSTDHSAPAGA
jgi:hypothetical protein